MLTNQQIQKFKELYQKRFGEVLDDEQVAVKAGKLLGLIKLIYKPLTKKEFEKFSEPSARQTKEQA